MKSPYYSGRYFPDDVFNSSYENYLAISFELIFLPGFLEDYCNLLKSNGAERLYVETLLPDVKSINIKCSVNSEHLYFELMKEIRDLEYIDAPMSFYQLVDKGAFFTEVDICPIYIDREFELAILGSNHDLEVFRRYTIKSGTLLQYLEEEVLQKKCNNYLRKKTKIWDEKF